MAVGVQQRVEAESVLDRRREVRYRRAGRTYLRETAMLAWPSTWSGVDIIAVGVGTHLAMRVGLVAHGPVSLHLQCRQMRRGVD
jgi:hypothetical protein